MTKDEFDKLDLCNSCKYIQCNLININNTCMVGRKHFKHKYTYDNRVKRCKNYIPVEVTNE